MSMFMSKEEFIGMSEEELEEIKNSEEYEQYSDELDEEVHDFMDEKESTEEPEEYLIGKVENCVNLRVRKDSRDDGLVLGHIPYGSEVMVYPDESTDDFYSVVTESGIEGYCMRQFIEIQQ